MYLRKNKLAQKESQALYAENHFVFQIFQSLSTTGKIEINEDPYAGKTQIYMETEKDSLRLVCFTPSSLPLTISQLLSLGLQVKGYDNNRLKLFGRKW